MMKRVHSELGENDGKEIDKTTLTNKLEKYMNLADYKANSFSKDPFAKVCALILAPDSLQELSSGFNGPPRKVDDTVEKSGIVQLSISGWNTQNVMLYIMPAVEELH